VVYDVGGGAGVYACSLAGRGYEVHLLDAAPLHVEQARQASAAQPDAPLAGVGVGDARRLPWPEANGDAVLLLGPLYHLTERADRLTALREARRVLRPGGVVCAAAISRWASALDGLVRGFLDDPEFVAIVERDLADGQHRNPSNRLGYFTTSFFHRPEELRAEVEAAGLRLEALVGIEGPGGLLADLEARWADERRRAQALQVARWLEAEPALLGLSAHLLAIARREG
jgi:ubiquinone/menaquinone biosynthesis C-methylase UbiE